MCACVLARQETGHQLRGDSREFAYAQEEQVPWQAPGYLHIAGEIENVMLGLRLRPLLRPVPRETPPFRSLRCCHQQEQLVAALRVGSWHGGQMQALAVLVGRGASRAAAAAAQVHGSGLRA